MRYTFIKQKMKVKYRDLSESIQQKSVVCYDDMSKDARLEKENQTLNYMKYLQKEKLHARKKQNLPFTSSSMVCKPISDSSESINATYDMSFLKSVKTNKAINKFEHKSVTTSRDFSHNVPQKNENSLSMNFNDCSNIQSAYKFQHSRLGSLTSNTSNNLQINFSSTCNDSESKMSNFKMQGRSRPISKLGLKRKIFEEEMQKKSDDPDYKREGQNQNCSISKEFIREDEDVVRNKKLMKNLKNWQKTTGNKTKSSFNTGSFNLPLFVFKNGSM
jgi:hypothetical protein